ncbi:MAG: hypothetical protein ACT4P6_18605 [Gemmatimonadaceae bacterium]
MALKRVSEAAPVQVYLDVRTRQRLDQLTERLGTTKSEVLRRGLLALERETTNPDAHPVLRLVGSVTETPGAITYDVAREHDRFLAEVHEAAPRYGAGKRRKRG